MKYCNILTNLLLLIVKEVVHYSCWGSLLFLICSKILDIRSVFYLLTEVWRHDEAGRYSVWGRCYKEYDSWGDYSILYGEMDNFYCLVLFHTLLCFIQSPYMTCRWCNLICYIDVAIVKKILTKTTDKGKVTEKLPPCRRCNRADCFVIGPKDFAKEIEERER